MKLSIVIVNYRAWGHLQSALNGLQPDFPDDWELIVVDNESEPAPFNEFAGKYAWVNFVANESNSGFGFGCNIGVAHSTGEYLLFMNPDVIASCGHIRSLLRIMQDHPDIAVLSPKQVNSDGQAQKVFDDFPRLSNQSKLLKALLRLLPSHRPNPRAEHKALTYCDWVTGSFLLLSRRDFDAIGGWSEDYWMYVEDADLCRRAQDQGLRVAYTPDVEVIHAHGGSSRLNVAVKAMTKLEVIISKHVYTEHHFRGVERLAMHGLIALFRLPLLGIAALADLLTMGKIPTLNVRRKIFGNLIEYYRTALRSGIWLSPRAIANQSAAE